MVSSLEPAQASVSINLQPFPGIQPRPASPGLLSPTSPSHRDSLSSSPTAIPLLPPSLPPALLLRPSKDIPSRANKAQTPSFLPLESHNQICHRAFAPASVRDAATPDLPTAGPPPLQVSAQTPLLREASSPRAPWPVVPTPLTITWLFHTLTCHLLAHCLSPISLGAAWLCGCD